MRTEDGCIIQRCLDGEPEAFGVLVDKYKAGIYAFAYTKLRNFHDAQDVAQEVFEQAYSDLRSLRRWESFHFWLYRIAFARCKKWIRSRSRRPDKEFIEDQNPAITENLSLNSYREEQANESLNESLRTALDSLPETYREALMLRYFGGMTSEDIARALSISPTAIRMRLSRARARLKEEMVSMMDKAFEGQRLQAIFTFRVMEAVKRIKVQPIDRTAGLPWGLSLAAGIVIAVLSIGSHLSLSRFFDVPAGADSLSEARMMEISEIPVDISYTWPPPSIPGFRGYSNGGVSVLSAQQNAVLMAPQGEGGEFPEEPSIRLGKGYLGDIAYSPDGKILAAAGGLGIWLYDASNLSEIELIREEPYYRIAFSPDGKTLAVSDQDYIIHLWNVNEQTQTGELKGHTAYLYCIAFSPDGKTLASGSYDKKIFLWDIQEQKRIGVLQGHTDGVASIAFSPDSKMLASGGWDKTIRLWDIQGQRQTGLLQGHKDAVRSVVFSLDGNVLASGSNDKTIRLWDVQGQKQIGLMEGHTEGLSSIALSPDRKTLASGSWDTTIRLWDIQGQKQTGIIEGSMNSASSLAFSPDGKLLASIDSGAIRLWDVQEQEQTAAVEGFTNSSSSLAFSPDGKILVSGTWGEVSLWDFQEQKLLGRLDQGSGGWVSGLNSVAFSPDGKILASISTPEIYLFDVQKQERIGTLKGHTATVSSVAFTPDGKTLVSSGNQDQTVRLWDIAEKKESGVLINQSWVHTVVVSPDGGTIAAAVGAEALIRLWDTRTRKEIGVLNDPVTAAFSVAFSPDGQTIATCNQNGIIRIWDYRKRKLLYEFQGPKTAGSPSAVIINFSPDGKWLVSLYGGNAQLWDVQGQREIAIEQEQFHNTYTVAFSPDGKWLATSGYEGTILLWEVNLTVPGWSVEPTGKLPGTWGDIKKAELLQNYPNPFNPDTWIPYRLAEDADVTVSIRNVSGQLVRELRLGRRPAGSYIDKAEAAYWDGANEAGEEVASDVYFYTIQAGNFTATRKMVVAR